MSNEKPKGSVIGVRVSKGLRDAVSRMAVDQGYLNESDFLRTIIREKVKPTK
jgi:metal-responsive CopG/Arc/MetJ family transcriptional regulator